MMFKRFFSSLLIIFMASSLCFVSAFAAEETPTVADTEEMEFLKAIGIIDDDILEEGIISRGVYSRYLANFFGTVTEISSDSLEYADVKKDDDCAGAVSLLTSYGLLNGYDDGNFYPEKPIKLTDASKVIVDMLGYKYDAYVKGGYPTGYMIVSQELGLLDNIDDSTPYLNKENLITLLYNAVDVDLRLENGLVKRDDKLTVNTTIVKGKTLLTENFNLYRKEGVITANSITNISGDSVGGNELLIDGVSVTCGNRKYWDMVGYYVEYVYRQVEGSNKRVLVYASPKDNSSITLTKETFIGLDDLKVTYSDDNGKIKKVNLAADVDFVYNGRCVPFNSDYLDGLGVGKITLINNDDDNSYEVVLIENYTSFVVENAYPSQNKVDDGFGEGNSIFLDSARYEKMLLLDTDGIEVSFDAISAGSTLTYFINNGYLKAYVSNNIVSGVVDSIGTVNGSKKYVIGGKNYYEPANYTGEIATVGENVTLYLDAFGYIAKAEKTIGDGLITGFLLGSGPDGVFTNKYGFRILSSDGKVVVVFAQDKIMLNGVKTGIEDLSLDQGIVCYKLNVDGMLTALETPVARDDSYVDGRLVTLVDESTVYHYGRMFDSRIAYDGTTTLFAMPEKFDENGEQQFSEYTEDMVKVIRSTDVSDSKAYKVSAYAISKEDVAIKAAVFYQVAQYALPKRDNLATVADACYTLLEDGSVEYAATVYVEGVKKELTFGENVEGITGELSLKPGDTFRYGTGSDDKVNRIEMVYTIDEGWQYSEYDAVPDTEVSIAYGKVIANNGSFIKLIFDDETYSGYMHDYYSIPMNHYINVTVMTVGDRTCTVTTGKIQDVAVGDYVINYRNLMSAVGFVVIKQE